MPNPPEPSDDDPLGLEGVDREIRIEKLLHEIDAIEVGEMFSDKIADCDPKVKEAFLENVLALETHGFVCPFETLVKDGFELAPPEKLDDAALTMKLWELIRELAKRRLFLHSTNHLSDRELYTWLVTDALLEELMGFGACRRATATSTCLADAARKTSSSPCAITPTTRIAPAGPKIFPTFPCHLRRSHLTTATGCCRRQKTDEPRPRIELSGNSG